MATDPWYMTALTLDGSTMREAISSYVGTVTRTATTHMTPQNSGMQSQQNHRAHVNSAAETTGPALALLLLKDDLKAFASNVEMRITGCAHA